MSTLATEPKSSNELEASAEQKSPALTDGFHLVVDALKLNGIDTIYGVAGIPITDLARLAQPEGIRYIGFRHEQSAGNAAAIAGYLTKKPGICLTVSAPGFLNGLVALANATTNGFPMIQISGSSDREIIDLQQGDYEELDQMNAAKPYTKASFRVEKPEDIGIGLARAIHAAVSGRPGGVYLDLTADVLAAALDADAGRNRWCALSIQLLGKSPPLNRSNAPSTCWRAHNAPSLFSAKAQPTLRLTLTFGRSLRRRVFLFCRCPWPKGFCRITILNPLPRPAPWFWLRPMWSC
jgi:hypothetical protein